MAQAPSKKIGIYKFWREILQTFTVVQRFIDLLAFQTKTPLKLCYRCSHPGWLKHPKHLLVNGDDHPKLTRKNGAKHVFRSCYLAIRLYPTFLMGIAAYYTYYDSWCCNMLYMPQKSGHSALFIQTVEQSTSIKLALDGFVNGHTPWLRLYCTTLCDHTLTSVSRNMVLLDCHCFNESFGSPTANGHHIMNNRRKVSARSFFLSNISQHLGIWSHLQCEVAQQ